MTGEIIERSEEGKGQTLNIGDNRHISMKTFQYVYNQITDKTEKLVQILKNNHEIHFADINQLNTKIFQLYEQYHIVSDSCAITIFHVDDCKEQFSSFERFEKYDSSNTSPIENIRLEYNFLIILPKTQKPQPYKITIDLASRMAFRKKAYGGGAMHRFMIFMSTRTGNVEIEFVDYTVARTFKTAIDQWYEAVKQEKNSKYIEILQNISEYFPALFKILTSLFVLSVIFYNREALISTSSTLDVLFSLSLVSFGTVYISGLVAAKLGQLFGDAIDSHQTISASFKSWRRIGTNRV